VHLATGVRNKFIANNATVLLGFNRKFCAAKGSTSREILHVEPLNYLRAKFLIAQEGRNCGEFAYGFSICRYRSFSKESFPF